jgi:hypothetical protein
MFSSNIVYNVVKEDPFNIYNYVQSHFISIKNLNSFQAYTIISSNDLIIISNIISDCIDQLGNISVLYISKTNDSKISVHTVDQLHKMYQLHNDLIDNISKFSLISLDITNNIKEIHKNNLNQEIVNYIYYDITSRYKLIILKILEIIKKLNVYIKLVKDEIN